MTVKLIEAFLEHLYRVELEPITFTVADYEEPIGLVVERFSIVDGTIEWECGAELSNDTFYIVAKSLCEA